MQAVILMGGKGTRLNSLYPQLPKALVPIAGKPFIEWQIGWLRRDRVVDIHLACGHLAHQVREWVAHAPIVPPPTFSQEPQPLGTGGGLKYVEPFLQTDPFLVLNGDSLTPNLDFSAMLQTWQAEQPVALIAVTHIHEAGRYGTVEFDEAGRITAFKEKASRDGGWINAGVYIARKALFDLIDPDRPVSLETEVFPALVERGLARVHPTSPPVLDMGTPDGIRALDSYLATYQPEVLGRP